MRTAETREVHIGKVVRNAVLFNFGSKRGGAVQGDDLLKAVSRLFILLGERRTDYLLVGGIALLKYVEGRNTEDIDLIMALSSLEKLPEIRIDKQDDDFARGTFDGLQIDLLLTSNPLFEKVRRRYATTQRFVEREIPCATVEGLLLLKLYALPSLYRQGNFARVALYEGDIATLMHDYRPPVEPLFEELKEHLSTTDMASLRKITGEIQERIERFDRQ
ncbi:MAG: hypothetical protein QOH06_4882 [Acidobacteriota bacterium]|jgi:predicted nucleotidyltransferase|nr:hypothetical protein [Acidobacteriota bacterium]